LASTSKNDKEERPVSRPLCDTRAGIQGGYIKTSKTWQCLNQDLGGVKVIAENWWKVKLSAKQ